MSNLEPERKPPRSLHGILAAALQTELYNNLAPVMALVALTVVMTIGSSRFFDAQNLINILTQGTVLLVLGVGATFVIVMGSIDLSIATNMALAGVLVARLIPAFGHWADLLAALAAALLGLINGLIVTVIRIPSFIGTLGTSGAMMGLAYWFCNAQPVYITEKNFVYREWVTREVMGVPIMVLVSFGVLLLAWGIERFTRLGHYTLAIGAGESEARLSGVPIRKYKTIAFALSGFCAGIAGVLFALRVSVGSPRLGDQFLLLTVAVVVIGGTSLVGGSGGVLRTLVGTVLISALINGLNLIGIDAFIQQIAIGILVIGAVTMTIDRRHVVFVK